MPAWRRTWPDTADDWTMKAPDGYCRTYIRHDGTWYWCVARSATEGSGIEATKDAAMSAAKRVWEATAGRG